MRLLGRLLCWKPAAGVTSRPLTAPCTDAKEYNSEYKHRKDVIAAHSAECAAEERELVELDRKALSESAFRGRKGQLPECVTITKNGVLPAAMKIVTALTDPKAYAKEHKEAFSVAVAKEFAPAGKEAAAVRIAQAAFPQDRA